MTGSRVANRGRIGFKWLVRAKHVVVSGDNRNIGYDVAGQRRLVLLAAGGKPVRQVAARQCATCRSIIGRRMNSGEVSAARLFAAFLDSSGHFLHYRIHHSTLPVITTVPSTR